MNDFSIRAYVANLDKYNEGELVGEWVEFPVYQEEMQGVLDRIGIGQHDPLGNAYDEIFITEIASDIPQISEIVSRYSNMEKLNYFAACVQALSEEEYAKYREVLESGQTIPEEGIDGLINLTFNLDKFDVLPAVRNAAGISLRPMTPEERMYSYSQNSQIESQTGLIGHLRGDMDYDGSGFFTSWTDHNGDLKTDEFKKEFDTVINALRSDPTFGGLLKNKSSLSRYGFNHPESAFTEDYLTDFGFRADTKQYSYFLRLNARQGDYNLYCYAYYRPWVEQHMKEAKAGIRFIMPDYEDLFRLPDGGKIRIIQSDGRTQDVTCRFIDAYHMETSGGNVYHIAEFAEKLQRAGCTIKPLSPVIQNKTEKKAAWKRVYDAELDSIPEEYRLPTERLEKLKECVIEAMKIAGYGFKAKETDFGCLRFQKDADQVTFGSWKEAETWLDNAFVDEPDLSEKVSEVLHPDKKMTVLVVEPKKEPYVKTIDPGLESLQHEVGGYIEAVYPFEDVALIVNEEGKLEGLPLNRALFDDEGRLYDVTAGTMLVVGLGESNFCSLSPELLEKYMNVYKQPEMFIRINQEMRVFPIVQEGKETADKLAKEAVQVISDNGYDGYVKASPKQIAETKEAYSIIIRSGDDYTIRRALMDISNSGSDCAARAQGLIQQLDSFYLEQETPHYTIYQLSFDRENIRDYSFRSYDELQKAGLNVDAQNYSCVYSGRMPDGATLDTLYEKFNLHRPKDFTGHSMSVSDVIVMTQHGENQAYYVDSFGFANVPEFLESSQRAQEKVKEKSTTQSRLSDSKAKTSVLSKLQEKKAQAAELNKKKEKPEKSKELDLS